MGSGWGWGGVLGDPRRGGGGDPALLLGGSSLGAERGRTGRAGASAQDAGAPAALSSRGFWARVGAAGAATGRMARAWGPPGGL